MGNRKSNGVFGSVIVYAISEIFRSIQGEGPDVGRDAVFVRFSGCNLKCSFCDEYSKYDDAEPMTAEEIVTAVLKLVGEDKKVLIVLTGGEPLLQLDSALRFALLGLGLPLAIETNGAAQTENEMRLSLTELFDFDVTVSPKDAPLSAGLVSMATTLKLLVPSSGKVVGLEHVLAVENSIGGGRGNPPARILQPITDRQGNIAEAAQQAMLLARKMSRANAAGWRVIPQVHVWMQLK